MNNSQNYSNKRIRTGNLSTRIEKTVGEEPMANVIQINVFSARAKNGYSMFMSKPLVDDASFSQTYGGNFFLTRLDSF
jgi:hypothetical protein